MVAWLQAYISGQNVVWLYSTCCWPVKTQFLEISRKKPNNITFKALSYVYAVKQKSRWTFSSNNLICCMYTNTPQNVFRSGSLVHFLQILQSSVWKVLPTRNFLYIFCNSFTPRSLANKIGKNSWKLSTWAKRTHKLHTDTFKTKITKTKQFYTRNN